VGGEPFCGPAVFPASLMVELASCRLVVAISLHALVAQSINSPRVPFAVMEAVFLIQPWVQARTAMDCCKLCYQERDGKSHLECKRSHLAACNSLLAVLKLERGAAFEEKLRLLEDSKQTCVSTARPDEHCHGKSQEALKQTAAVYDKILEDYKKRLPSRESSTPRI
jgi:hypothetical protein